MTDDRQRKDAAAFLALHQAARGFIMPNAWDAGSAIVLAQEGFAALGSTSAGIAFSAGKPDYMVDDPRLSVSRDQMLACVREIVDAAQSPINADLEAGYGDDLDAIAETIRRAAYAGAAGGNIEDMSPNGALFEEAEAVARIGAARAALPRGAFVLTARTDAFQTLGDDALAVAIRRGNKFLEAGADCVFTPGVADLDTIRTLVREIAGPLNIVVGLTGATGSAHAMIDAGVKRISTGGSIARAALGFIRRSALELRDRGTFAYAQDQIPHRDLNALFAKARTER